MSATIEVVGVIEVSDELKKLSSEIKLQVNDALFRVTQLVKREAVKNAPISPTEAQKNLAKAQAGKPPIKHRKGYVGKTPGGLMRSIESMVNTRLLEGYVYVARESEAGAYANYIHNLKGIRWFNRGIGTIAKGPRADEKFIERALDENESTISNIIDKAVAKATKTK